MYKARYYKADGKKGRARALPDALFDGVVNEGVLHQAVKVYLANQRQGTGSAKNRSAVRGGSRKPWRQKGTGRARQGTIRAAQWEGGGRAFPPIPHSWRQKLPRKVRALARRSAFNSRAEDDRVVLIDALSFEAPKTAQLRGYLGDIEAGGRKVLLLTHGVKSEVYLSGRNMPDVQVRPFGDESPYDILWADLVIIETDALDALDAAEPEAKPKKKAAAAKKPAAEKPAAKKASAKKAATKKASAKKAAAEDEAPEAEAAAETEEAEVAEKPAAKKKAAKKPAAKKKAAKKKETEEVEAAADEAEDAGDAPDEEAPGAEKEADDA